MAIPNPCGLWLQPRHKLRQISRALQAAEKLRFFRGSELQLRHKFRGFNRALAPEERILTFFRSLLKQSPQAFRDALCME